MSDIDVEPVDDVDEATEDSPPPDEAGDDDGDDGAPIDDAPEDVPEELAEAERVAPLPEDAPEFVLYGGKGGVGKTTMAAATGLASAVDDTRTLVVSTDPAHSLSDTYETDIGPEPTRISDSVPLYAAEIDPDAAMEQGMSMFGGAMDGSGASGAGTGQQAGEDPFGGSGAGGGDAGGGPFGAGGPFGGGSEGGGPMGGDGPMGGLGALLGGSNPMESMLGGTMPGSDEAVAMQQLVEFMDDDRFDRVVVDTAPTGHTLRLLELPELMDTMVGRLLKLRERMSGLFDGLGGMFGGEQPEEPDEGIDDLQELSDRIERLRSTLQDPALTDFRIVMVPEELSVIESERLLRQLDDFSIPVETVVVNKVMEDLADVTDAVDAEAIVTPNLDTCDFCQRRWDVQQDALTRAQEVFRGRSIKRVPLLADEVRGERPLRVVAACLER